MIILKTSREKGEEKVFNKLKEKGVLQKSDDELKILAKNSIDEAELNEDNIIPKAFDLKVQKMVAEAV